MKVTMWETIILQKSYTYKGSGETHASLLPLLVLLRRLRLHLFYVLIRFFFDSNNSGLGGILGMSAHVQYLLSV